MRVFLSYARDDDEGFVKRLADALEEAAVEVWFDRRSMPSRSLTFLDEIRRAIDGADRVIAVMGPAARRSDYVWCEWQYALIRDKPVVPILRLGEYGLPPELRNLHCPDVRASRRWKDAFAEVLHVLNEPLPELGDAVGLPSLPPYFRPRPEAVSRLAATVMLDLRTPVNIERWQRVTLLSGMGGAGKSVLASALARSIETRRAFTNGIYWLDMRRVPGPEAGLETLTRLVAARGGGGGAAPTGPAEQRLKAQLQGKRCLLVLDNVEDVAQLESFVRCVDTMGRVLVTTRKRDLIGEAYHVLLTGLEGTAARQQLADWLQLSPDAFDNDCETILKVCEGLPFAIALCGSLIAGGVSRSAVASKLRSMDLAALERRFPDYEYPGVLPSLEVSVEALGRATGHAVACFERMVVFAPGAVIPESTLILLWRQSLGLDDATCSFELARLCSHSLVRSETEDGAVSLHQLVHAYLSQRVPDPRLLHEELLTAYASVASSDWVQGPQDGYYHAQLVYHLLAARGVAPVCDLLVGSPDWMREKLKIEGSALSYLVDVERALHALDDSDAAVLPLARLAAARHLARKGPRSYGEGILKAMVRLGLVQSALEFARANVDPVSRVGQLLEIYETLAEGGDKRRELLDEVERSSTRNAGSVPMESVRSKLIELHARAGRLDDALRLWHALSEWAGSRTGWMRQMLARRLAEEGRVVEARALEADLPQSALAAISTSPMDFDAAERNALAVKDPDERDLALSQLVRALSEDGQLQRARAAAHAITRPAARVFALTSIAWKPCLQEALDAARKLEGVSRVLGMTGVAEMLQRWEGIKPAVSLRDRLYGWVHRLPTAGPRETATELMAEAERESQTMEPFDRARSLRYLAFAAPNRARGQSRRLLRAARECANDINDIKDPWRKARELAEIAGDLARLRDDPDAITEGRAALAQAMILADASNDLAAAARARAAVAGVLARNQRFDLALTLVQEITDENERKDALGHIARMCADAGEPERVEIIVARSPTDFEAPRQFAVALARAGRYDAALNAAAELRHEETLLRIARVLAEGGHTQRALELLDTLSSEDRTACEHVAALAEIACSKEGSAARHSALERARTIAEAIRSTTYKSMALAELARAEAHLGETVARARFEQAVELANAEDKLKPLTLVTLAGPSARFFALKRIGERMTDAGFAERALALAASLAGETDDEWRALRASLISTVASHALRKGTLDHKRAEELFAEALASARRARNSMIGPAWQLGALLHVADRLAEAGRLRAAFEALGLAHFTVDPFVIGLTAWADTLERRVVGLSLSVIIAVAEIFGWQRPDWKAVAEAITGASN